MSSSRRLAASLGQQGTLALCGSLLLGGCGGSTPVPVEDSETSSSGGPGSSGGATSGPICPKGHFVQDAGPDSSCVPCPEGSFSAGASSTSCTPWSVCPDGEDSPGTAESDRLCRVDDWTTEIGSSGEYMVFDVAAHADGDIVVVGYRGIDFESGGSVDPYIRRYDAFGREKWARAFGTDEWDNAVAVSAGLDGSSYVVGYTEGSMAAGVANGGMNDGYVSKIDELGNVIWTRQFGGGGNDHAESVSTDHAGNVFVGGSTFEFSSGTKQGFVRKFDSEGNGLWVTTVGSVSASNVFAVATDSLGNVYAAGSEYTPNAIGEDMCLHKLDANGNEQWVAHFDGGNDDGATAVAVDSEDNAIVYGRTWLPEALDYPRGMLRKYNSDGALLWSTLTTGFGVGEEYSVAVDKSDNVIIATGINLPDPNIALVGKYAPDGGELWTETFGVGNATASGVCVDLRNDILVVGWDFDGGVDAFVRRMVQ